MRTHRLPLRGQALGRGLQLLDRLLQTGLLHGHLVPASDDGPAQFLGVVEIGRRLGVGGLVSWVFDLILVGWFWFNGFSWLVLVS